MSTLAGSAPVGVVCCCRGDPHPNGHGVLRARRPTNESDLQIAQVSLKLVNLSEVCFASLSLLNQQILRAQQHGRQAWRPRLAPTHHLLRTEKEQGLPRPAELTGQGQWQEQGDG